MDGNASLRVYVNAEIEQVFRPSNVSPDGIEKE
jgi:hypothetical protein